MTVETEQLPIFRREHHGVHLVGGRHVEHDERSRGFAIEATPPIVTKWWRLYGSPLDQGQVGSCTGNATAGCLNHAPDHVVGSPLLPEPEALAIYELATQLDGFPGTYPPDDTGSSGLAAAKAAVQRGDATGYHHAFGLDQFLAGLMSGPMSVGTNWYEDMFNPDSQGVIHPPGQLAGGHQYVADGYNATHGMIRFCNSWSRSWGLRGRFWMHQSEFANLLGANGDSLQLLKTAA